MASTFQNLGRAQEILALFPDWNIEEADAKEIVTLMLKELIEGRVDFKKKLLSPGYTMPQLDALYVEEGKTLEDKARERKAERKLNAKNNQTG